MTVRTRMALLVAIGGLALVPAAVVASPSVSVAPDGSSVTVSDTSCTSGPGVGTHETKECGSATVRTDGSDPTGTWCGQVAGVGGCGEFRSDGAVTDVAGVCAWYYDDWQPNTSPTSCVNGGGCVVLAVVENPNGCGG